jgi:hypothetical protein
MLAANLLKKREKKILGVLTKLRGPVRQFRSSLKIIQIIHKTPVYTQQKTLCIFITKTSWLILLGKYSIFILIIVLKQ